METKTISLALTEDEACYLPALSVLNKVGLFDTINLKFAEMLSDSSTQKTASLV